MNAQITAESSSPKMTATASSRMFLLCSCGCAFGKNILPNNFMALAG